MPTDIYSEVENLRNQGLTDSLITDELTRKGYSEQEVNVAISSQDDEPVPMPGGGMSMPEVPSFSPLMSSNSNDGNIYERIEEMTESMIDEKWDELIAEVRKIVDWKDKMEEKQTAIVSDVKKLKEDFAILHQGVLGKLDDYDSRMKDVGTELNAVSKVFKDVIPEFVENVKELKHMTRK